MVIRDIDSCGYPGDFMMISGLYDFLSEQPSRDDPEEDIFFYHGDHLGSTSFITDASGLPSQHVAYLPFGEVLLEEKSQTWQSPYKFNCKELDDESGLYYYGARYYDPKSAVFLMIDPLSDKYPSISPYMYCAGNPIRYVDPNGMEWVDGEGNKISDHRNIKVYIFYNSKAFEKQSLKMAQEAEKKYGKGSVALSDVTTNKEFAKDWQDMGGNAIKEVNINHHGSNQAIHLDYSKSQYITATGNGFTNREGTPALNVKDLPVPVGNIHSAQLNINTCHSNSFSQYPLKGEGRTLAGAFNTYFDFKLVRGTSSNVNYNYISLRPEPNHYLGSWDFLPKQRPTVFKSDLR